MKKVLILYPHFPPSNLTGVHRPRLFSMHLPEFGWRPTVLTVHEDYYEEAHDHNLVKLLPPDLCVEKVTAFKVGRVRLIGDVGLRAFFQLFSKAKELIQKEAFDFLFIPVPSFYCSLLGRWLHSRTGIKYGIDYIDPWVHRFPGSERKFSRHWWSTKISGVLEPIAVKKASLITGIAEGYYKGVIERNPHLARTCRFSAMPYGGEAEDHRQAKKLQLQPYLFSQKSDKLQLVYAGAMLPKAFSVLEAICTAISENRELFQNVEFHFIGSGKLPNDPQGFNIKPLAEKYGLWQTVFFEHPARIPYLDVLVHLEAASGVFILGSTEPHYTPSKVYQAILSEKPILAVLHEKSMAFELLQKAKKGITVGIRENNLKHLRAGFVHHALTFLQNLDTYKSFKADQALFEEYSAKEVTRKLAGLLNTVCER